MFPSSKDRLASFLSQRHWVLSSIVRDNVFTLLTKMCLDFFLAQWNAFAIPQPIPTKPKDLYGTHPRSTQLCIKPSFVIGYSLSTTLSPSKKLLACMNKLLGSRCARTASLHCWPSSSTAVSSAKSADPGPTSAVHLYMWSFRISSRSAGLPIDWIFDRSKWIRRSGLGPGMKLISKRPPPALWRHCKRPNRACKEVSHCCYQSLQIHEHLTYLIMNLPPFLNRC